MQVAKRTSVGFSYSSATKTLVCLGHNYSPVYPSEIEDYIKKAVINEKRTHPEPVKNPQAKAPAKPKRKQPSRPDKPVRKPLSNTKPQAKKAKVKKPDQRKKI